MSQLPYPPPADRLEVGVDYLTVTASTPEHREALASAGAIVLAAIAKERPKGGIWTWMGYQGYHLAGCSVGERPDGVIVRLSGADADYHWRECAKVADHCSRIDLAVTAWEAWPEAYPGQREYAAVDDLSKDRGKPLTVTLVQSNDAHNTLYIGSRSSDKFMRVYNKGGESREPHYAGATRYELECKGAVAERWCKDLVLAGDDVRKVIRDTVVLYCEQRGLTIPKATRATTWLAPVHRAPTTDESRRHWLGEQVRPTVTDLVGRYGLAEIRAILGLGESDTWGDGR